MCRDKRDIEATSVIKDEHVSIVVPRLDVRLYVHTLGLRSIFIKVFSSQLSSVKNSRSV